MANLLPQDQLDIVLRFYRSRFVIVWAVSIIVLAAISAAALSPSFFILWSEMSSERALQHQKGSDEKADRAALARSQAILAQLVSSTSTTSPMNAITYALSKRPKGLMISHISYVSGQQNTIFLSGTTQTRDALNAFKGTLQSDPLFKSVLVPVDDLVGSASTFSMTITGNF